MSSLENSLLSNKVALIVEDDPDILRILRQYTKQVGMRVHSAGDGEMALKIHHMAKPDIILLDIGIPKLDGFEVLKVINQNTKTPTIVISARVEDEDKLLGLGLGADDYVVKPFNPQEVMARIEAVLRRTEPKNKPKLLRFGDLCVDLNTGEASVEKDSGMQAINLTPSEFLLLTKLMAAPNKTHSRLELIETCFLDSDALVRTIDSHLSHLRKKLSVAGAGNCLTVVRGLGYRLQGVE